MPTWDTAPDGSSTSTTWPPAAASPTAGTRPSCRHETEPGCAVRRAVEDGELPAGRLAGWHKLQRELRALERRHDQRARAEERRRWRSLSKSMREHTKRTR
jgi:hypothetical protein